MATTTATDLAQGNGTLTPEELASLGKPSSEARGLAPRLYTDRAVFAAEKEKIFKREWVAVFHQGTIPNPGDFRVFDFAGESYLFVRGKDGEIRGFHNICRHRGAQVAAGEGNCNRFRCPYHTWTYDLEGRLVGAPEMAHVVREGIGLAEVRIDTWLGFVYMTENPDAEPLASKLAPLDDVLAPFHAVSDRLESMYEIPFTGDWNWKLTCENAFEGYHVIGSHYESAGDLIPGELTYTETTDYRHYTDFIMPFAEGRNIRDETGGAVDFDHLPPWIDEHVRFYVVWPNIIYYFAPEAIVAGIAVPGDGPDKVSFNWSSAVLPETKANPKYEDYREVQIGWATTIQTEDQYPCETMWANMHSEAFVPGPYATQEHATFHFDQWYLSRMAAD